ncbi:MAG: cardiolipin synthase [Firmicutes bacterium]|nr:cardiolipin synthase [Bacillota bacterium]
MLSMLLIMQILLLVFMISTSSQNSDILSGLLTLISLLVVLYIISKKDKPAFKLSWVFMILFFPVFGGLFYLLFNFQSSTRRARRAIEKVEEHSRPLFDSTENLVPILTERGEDCIPQVRYLQDFAGFPVYENTRTQYLTPGEVKFAKLIDELKTARNFIFLEYFIISRGLMWDTILEVLREKVQQGVEVRVIYDDMGCFFRLPKDYHKTLADMGIQCAVFNRFRPILSTLHNNRDHRKLVVIDGKTAFTGGVNIGDEYINVVERFGHWKDAAIMVEGEAVRSFTLMFLQMWSLGTNTKEDYKKYLPDWTNCCPFKSDGYVQPYADSPMDKENVSEHVYIQIINNAKRYVYINTPYLIIDDTIISALALAAKSGVDVRIVTPHRWDKRLVHMTTRSYYRELIRAGVKIYEYTNGFIHSKTFVSDDVVATVGTPNLDFRSLYLHFECGVWLYKNSSVLDIKQDFLETLAVCHEITLDDCRSNAYQRFVQEVLRVFAPLM